MGTEAFPWKITFANMGQVTVTQNIGPSIVVGNDLAVGSASGITGNVSGLTHLVGSAANDRIYGIETIARAIVTFSTPSLPNQDADGVTDTLSINSATIDLQTGQAVLYQAINGEAIKGLVSGDIYFVGVEKTAIETNIKFYPNLEEVAKLSSFFSTAHAIKLSAPAAGATHKLFEVPQLTGGKGDDRLTAPTGTDTVVLLGGNG